MEHSDYLIAGASHAALAAAQAIRLHDEAGSVTVIAREQVLPYSPTVLPYVVSGRSDPERVSLCDADHFGRARIGLRRGSGVAGLDAAAHRIALEDGTELHFGKLLLATGARPVIPPIRGLESVPYHVLRTLDDAVHLRASLGRARRAIVVGGGLVGLHAAENLCKAGVAVTVVELKEQLLPGYFDATASALITRAFERAGVCIRTRVSVTAAVRAGEAIVLRLADDSELTADLLVVGAGVAPVMDYLDGAAVAVDRGILVDATMRTSAADVWAAGDVAQAPGFYDAKPVLNGILPDAVEQGRIAGMAMAGDPALAGYRGAVPLNTFGYFGRYAVSVGSNDEPAGAEVVVRTAPEREHYLKIILSEGCLHGIFAINVLLDAGVLWELIRRRTDLRPVREQFLAAPRETARILMSRLWR